MEEIASTLLRVATPDLPRKQLLKGIRKSIQKPRRRKSPKAAFYALIFTGPGAGDGKKAPRFCHQKVGRFEDLIEPVSETAYLNRPSSSATLTSFSFKRPHHPDNDRIVGNLVALAVIHQKDRRPFIANRNCPKIPDNPVLDS